jgi:hypothetical protein
MMEGRVPGERVILLLESLSIAVRDAEFGKIEAISAELETVLCELRPGEVRIAQRIATLARRNAACLEASAEGIRAGRRRLQEIAAAARGETYDNQGQRRQGPDGWTGMDRPLGQRL